MVDEGQSSRNPRKRVTKSLSHEPREHSTSKHNEVPVRSTGPLPVQSCRTIITQTKRDSYFKAWRLLATTVFGLACSTRLVRMTSNQCQGRPFIRLQDALGTFQGSNPRCSGSVSDCRTVNPSGGQAEDCQNHHRGWNHCGRANSRTTG